MTKQNDWFYNSGWGVCMHFLAISASTCDTAGLSSSSWNARVNAFDVKKLAAQLAEMKAGYLLLTIGQNSGYYCSPNSCYDRLVGPGFCSERDLPAELQTELARYNIPLLTYLPCNAPSGDIDAIRALDCIPPWDSFAWGAMNAEKLAEFATSDSRLRQFQHNWQNIIREWSVRWGKAVSGWWFDGCYFADKLYDFPDEPNFASFAGAARAGNPDSLVAFNPGVKYPPIQVSAEEDYLAGEINDLWKIPAVTSQKDYQARYHALTFAGEFWGSGTLRYSAGEMAAATAKVLNRDGVVTWDIPFNQADGTIRADDLVVLKEFAQLLPSERGTLPLPDAELAIISPPLRVWPGEHQTLGRGLLNLANPTAEMECWQLEGRTVRLNPGETGSVEIDLPSTSRNGNSIYCLKSGEYCRTFPLMPETVVHVSQDFAALPEIKSMDIAVGRFEMASSRDILHLRGVIFDENISQSEVPWMNSCIELFFVVNDKVEQYFLVPSDGIKPDAVSKMPHYAPVENIVFRTFPRVEGGYHCEASLPPEITGLTSGCIRMEIKVNVHNRFGFIRGQLFGVDNFSKIENYKGKLLIET